MDVPATYTNTWDQPSQLSFNCPSCKSHYSWSTSLPSARQPIFPVSCDCGVTFSVRSPIKIASATSPVVPSRASRPDVRRISIGAFALSILAFLLPFMSVSCQGQKFHTFSGRDLVMGADVESKDMFSGAKKTEHVPANPLAILALVAAVAGAAAAISNKTETPLAGICAAAGVALLLWLKSKLETDSINQTQGMVLVQPEFGFWAAVILLGIAAFCNFGLLQRLLASTAQAGTAKT